jgi:hypothetical protein
VEEEKHSAQMMKKVKTKNVFCQKKKVNENNRIKYL